MYIGITSLFFIFRFFLFVSTQDVGIEHDSGWYLGVARNVAERGIYASYTNTISSTEKAGGFPSIHGRFSVQDKSGFIYFPAGVTVGLGYVLPEAFFLKLFGYGWVQYRLWPFLAFCLLIPLLFSIILQTGSFVGLVIFQAWIYLFPQIFINQSYEALSEHIALLFLLLGFVLLQKAINHKKNTVPIILSGLFLGLSIQTKNLYALGILFSAGTILYLGIKKRNIKQILLFFIPLLLPTLFFESYRFIFLTSHFGLAGYYANNKDLQLTWQSGGSGIDGVKEIFTHKHFILNKLSIWKDLGGGLFVWIILLLTPFLQKRRVLLFWNIYTSVLTFFLWFILLSPTGWFRHIFPGVIMGMILICVSTENMLFHLFKKWIHVLIFAISLIIFNFYFPIVSFKQSLLNFPIRRGQIINLRGEASPNNLQGPISAPLFSAKDQDTVTTYFRNKIPKNTRVCFHGFLLVAELSPLVDRVFFPLGRCKENDILIIGPYQKGALSMNGTEYPYLLENVCKKILFSNASYTVCTIKK